MVTLESVERVMEKQAVAEVPTTGDGTLRHLIGYCPVFSQHSLFGSASTSKNHSRSNPDNSSSKCWKGKS